MMWEPGFWSLTDREAESFRAYLLKGGFAIFEDFDGPEQWRVFESQLRRVLPGGHLVRLDQSHAIFDSFFSIHDIHAIVHPMTGIRPSYYGVFEDNDPAKRLMVVANFDNDVPEYLGMVGGGLLPVRRLERSLQTRRELRDLRPDTLTSVGGTPSARPRLYWAPRGGVMLHRMAGVVCLVAWASAAGAQGRYYPDRFDWQRRSPAEAGHGRRRARCRGQVRHRQREPGAEGSRPRARNQSGRRAVRHPDRPAQSRAAANGLVIRHGYVVAEWGDTKAVDMTFSVTKTFLSTVVGLAWQKGLIRDVDRPRARLHAAGRRSLRRSAQPADHLGSPAAADQRLEGHALGQAGLGGSARGQARGVGESTRCTRLARTTSTTTCA